VHHDTNWAVVGIAIECVDVRHLYQSEENQQGQTQRGSPSKSPWRLAATGSRL